MSFVKTGALATPGNAITLSGRFRASDDDEVIEQIPSATIITSVDEARAAIRAGGQVTIDPNVAPPFTMLVGNEAASTTTTSARLGTVNLGNNGTVMVNAGGTDFEDHATLNSSTATISISHGVLSDTATKSVTLDAVEAATHDDESVMAREFAEKVKNGVLDFGAISLTDPLNIAAVTPTGGGTLYTLMVEFDGKTPISAHDAGEATVAFKTTSPTTAVPSTKQGALAVFRRGGLSAQINGARNSVGNGSTLYQSIVRVTNNGSNAGVVTVTLYDGADGMRQGSWTSPMIHPKGMIQVSVADLESGIGIDPDSIGFYTIDVDGPINGYVQHLNWNSTDNLFSDLSGFRVGAGTNVTEP